jgi:hypothetical protein
VDVYLQLEHGEELRSIAFEGRVRLRVDFNAIGPVVAVEPIGGAVVIEAESTLLPEAGHPPTPRLVAQHPIQAGRSLGRVGQR